ncbi:hypothetical protein GCM10010182_17310 [Actinomadura cremea]|nr:hypothetical protein GCM10010182_17310 [Actinomadura cremea]
MPGGDRYDETAQAAIDAAYGIAGAAGADATGCDHLVWGLRAGEGRPARLLADVLGGPQPPRVPSGYAPLSPDARRVLRTAASVRDRLRHPLIADAHLLLALLEEDRHAGRPLLDGPPERHDLMAAPLVYGAGGVAERCGPDVRRAVVRAAGFARGRGATLVEPDDLLLALADSGDPAVADPLSFLPVRAAPQAAGPPVGLSDAAWRALALAVYDEAGTGIDPPPGDAAGGLDAPHLLRGLLRGCAVSGSALLDAAGTSPARLLDGLPVRRPEPVRPAAAPPARRVRWTERETARALATAIELGERAARTGDRTSADRARDLFEQVVGATPHGHPERPMRLAAAAHAHLTAGGERLAQAVWYAHLAVGAVPRDHAFRPAALALYATALTLQADVHGTTAELPDAVAAARRAVHLARERLGDRTGLAPDEDVLSAALDVQGMALRLWFEASGARQAIDMAVAAGEEAVARTGDAHPKAGAMGMNLALALAGRAREVTGDRADARRAAELARRAVRLGHGSGDESPLAAGLAAVLGDPVVDGVADEAAAAEAVRACEAAVAAGGADARRPVRLANLSVALRGRAALGGPADTLGRAVDAAREAVEEAGEHGAGAGGANAALAAALLERYDRWGEPSDADEALYYASQAVELSPEGHADRLMYLGHAETAFARIHRRTGDPKLLDTALACNDAALRIAPPWHRVRAGTLAQRALLLHARYELGDGDGGDASVLDEALDVAAQAVDAAAGRPTDRAGRLVNLSSLLTDRYRAVGHVPDLDLAVEAAEEAVALTPAGDPRGVPALDQVSRARRDRAAGDDLPVALAHARTVVAARTAPVTMRASAAVRWGVLATALGDARHALTGYAAAVDLLPTVAWHGLRGATRRDRLENWPGVGSDAAACAIAAGDPGHALALAERGRNIVWSQLLDARSELDDLRAEHPELAERLAAVRAALDTD